MFSVSNTEKTWEISYTYIRSYFDTTNNSFKTTQSGKEGYKTF